MSKRIIGLDIDGVLANFNEAFKAVLADTSGRDLPTPGIDSPPVWNWPTHFGYNEAEERTAWAHVDQSLGFWANLRPLFSAEETEALLAAVQTPLDDLYFLTARPGQTAKRQTEDWLLFAGVEMPTVLLALPNKIQESANGVGFSKGTIGEALRLTHFVDDRAENCLWVKKMCPKTHVILLKHNYNAFKQDECVAAGIQLASTLLEVKDVIINTD
jgi:hypothetical protein